MERLEVVLLEDDPNDLDLVKSELEKRGIVVHAFADGNKALDKLRSDPHIEVLVTDIAIRYPFPNGKRSGPQGYDVTNRIWEEFPSRFVGVIVLTNASAESSLEMPGLFSSIYEGFHKDKWLKHHGDPAKLRNVFEELRELIENTANRSWDRWKNKINAKYPDSVWVKNPHYFPEYVALRRSWEWRGTENRIARRAEAIISQYKKGDQRRLQGGHLTIRKNPNSEMLQNHLAARRVVLAIRKVEPAHWESILQGEHTEEAERSLHTWWDQIQQDGLRDVITQIQRKLHDRNECKKNSKQTDPSSASRKMKGLNDTLKGLALKAEKLVINEPLEVKQGVDVLVCEVRTSSKTEPAKIARSQKPKDANRLQATLHLLGIRKEDIENDDPRRWQLLLPEEEMWLRAIEE